MTLLKENFGEEYLTRPKQCLYTSVQNISFVKTLKTTMFSILSQVTFFYKDATVFPML
jgi:hypothetical protein